MLLPTGALRLKEATTIAEAALAHARSEDMSPMAVCVVDAAGTVRCTNTEDVCALIRPDIAYGKAWTCVGLGFSTRAMHGAWQAMPAMNPALYSFMGLANSRLVPSPGGVFIVRGEEVLGAVGVSGDLPDRDEACALAGIEAAGLQSRI